MPRALRGHRGRRVSRAVGHMLSNIRKVGHPLLITGRCDRLVGIILHSTMFQLMNNYPECVCRKQRTPEVETLSRGGGGCVSPRVHFASPWPPCLKRHPADLDI